MWACIPLFHLFFSLTYSFSFHLNLSPLFFFLLSLLVSFLPFLSLSRDSRLSLASLSLPKDTASKWRALGPTATRGRSAARTASSSTSSATTVNCHPCPPYTTYAPCQSHVLGFPPRYQSLTPRCHLLRPFALFSQLQRL